MLDKLEKSLLLALGGLSVISRPLTDCEITVSPYFVLPVLEEVY